jgi:uncharacterized protein
MIRIVADTSVLISGLLWGGAPGEIMQGAVDGRWQLCSSEKLLEELAGVLRRPRFQPRLTRLSVTPKQFLADVRSVSALYALDMPPPIRCRDPNDDMIIACGIAAQAEYLVTGDADLLSLVEVGSTRIVSVRAFLDADLSLHL